MSSINQTIELVTTYEGGKAVRITPLQELRRVVCTCMLWEDSFYEGGESVVDRIRGLITKVKPKEVYNLAIKAREIYKLRHVPLLLVSELANLHCQSEYKELVRHVCQRPDDMMELLSLYWKDGRKPIPSQMKKGLKLAFEKFNTYQLAKYQHNNRVIKLRDVMKLVHPKPNTPELAELYKQLYKNRLKSPKTWERELSTGMDKKGTFTDLIEKNQIGGLAMLRNLRNMVNCQMSHAVIKQGINQIKTERILPFRFITAAKYTPMFEPELEAKMLASVAGSATDPVAELVEAKFTGKTCLLIDVSGSMKYQLSAKSEMTRMDAACAIAILLREMGDTDVFSFSAKCIQLPPRHGFALRDAIVNSQEHSATYLAKALSNIASTSSAAGAEVYDRLIVITDEQSHDSIRDDYCPKQYMVNIANYKNQIAFGKWVSINGFSEAVCDYIYEYELLGKDEDNEPE